MAFNLSHAELARGDAVAALEADLKAAGLPPTAVEIEITEEVLLDRVSEDTRARLVAPRGRGARLALDDFGTGGAGLAQVLRLPLDTLKVDRGFVRELGRDERAEEVVRATVVLARGLGLEVVAEGVETLDQLARLRSLGCDVTQGYLHAPALAPLDLASWLRARTVSCTVPGAAPGVPGSGLAEGVVPLRRRSG